MGRNRTGGRQWARAPAPTPLAHHRPGHGDDVRRLREAGRKALLRLPGVEAATCPRRAGWRPCTATAAADGAAWTTRSGRAGTSPPPRRGSRVTVGVAHGPARRRRRSVAVAWVAHHPRPSRPHLEALRTRRAAACSSCWPWVWRPGCRPAWRWSAAWCWASPRRTPRPGRPGARRPAVLDPHATPARVQRRPGRRVGRARGPARRARVDDEPAHPGDRRARPRRSPW